MNPYDLYAEHEHYAAQTLHRMFPDPKGIAKVNRIEYEDLTQYAKLGLWKACLSYKPDKAKFTTHAINNIQWYVKERLAREVSLIRYPANNPPPIEDRFKLFSPDEQCIEHDDNSMTYHDIIPSEYDIMDEISGSLLYDALEKVCSSRELELVDYRIAGKTSDQIGEIMNLTGSRVRSIWRLIRKKLTEFEERKVVSV
ncbi:hypothetical protein ANABIO32_02720 [Rossellomorea marisflavi]|uniref:sigma-70 family RNA polymerase sigma factor n=1 Tax=Rossellomorea marisflavi TaxID=189381 RepID=UPI0025C91906|nr:sigma-70 family RNA polymerase sigma factor [Rossellomorea marisflavi]GLI82585.1 hypothetical protein ANABIO32_02720 [Rossellomorea marisflavi]